MLAMDVTSVLLAAQSHDQAIRQQAELQLESAKQQNLARRSLRCSRLCTQLTPLSPPPHLTARLRLGTTHPPPAPPTSRPG